MILLLLITTLLVALAIALDGWWKFKVSRLIFGLDPASVTSTYGDGQAYSTLTWLLGIILTSGATFAASFQLNGDPFFPIFAYTVVSLSMLIGVSWILHARKKPDDSQREFTFGSIRFGQWVQATLIILASLSVIASLFGAMPGQSRRRTAFSQETLQCTVQPADDPRLAGVLFGVTSTRKQLDEASLNRWKTWMGRAKLEPDQRLVYVQSEPFGADYHPIQLQIDFDNPDVAFEDAFVIHVQNAPPNTITPPIYRLLGNPANPADVGQANSTQLLLPMNFKSAHLPVFNVPAPNNGDALALFVIVKSSNKDKALPLRGDERSMYLKLKRVN